MTARTNPYRLPTSVVPTNYAIELTPHIEEATFDGTVTIELDVRESVTSLSFNAVDLALDDITLSANGTNTTLTASFDAEYERATVALAAPLNVGAATLHIRFRGELNDKLVGFYKSTYVDDQGVSHAIATTQFEATDARRAFPCWDEPIFKATYDVTLNVPAHLQAYSNSPVASESANADGTRRVVFTRTMKMSTYLVAFVVGPFEETAAVDVLGTPLRVIYPTGKGHLAPFALEAGEFALDFFSKYFDIPYPGDKLDLIAIPDFAFGAMENLGCVTFRETALLVDPATASLAELERVADVVAHEIAHMWFGDLVTMQWWEGIWLNEAFATFMEVLCVEHFRPQWKKWVSFGTFRDMALQIDGLHSTRPIEYEVVSPADMRGMFDILTYEKGGSVLRMLEQYLGADVFRDGIRHYLRTHAYSNTVTTDLWASLEAVSKAPVSEMMNSFILQGGHPIVTYENGTLSQAPFAYGPANGPSNIGATWTVPVATRPLHGTEVTKHLLRGEPQNITSDGALVVNAGGAGVFRTRYGSSELAALTSNLAALDELERTVLVADTWAALFAGQITWSNFTAVARGLGDQDEPAVWTTVAQAYNYAYRVANDAQRAVLAEDVRVIAGRQFARLGFDAKSGENELAPQVRSIAIGLLGTIGGDESVRAEALRRYDAGQLDGDLARSILRIVADVNRPGAFDTMLQQYRDASSPQDKMRYLYALADFNDEALALRAAELCFSEFRTQDAPFVISMLTANRTAGAAVWRYYTGRWNEALERFPANAHSRMTGGLVSFFGDPTLAAEAITFHRNNPIEGEQKTVEQFIEKLEVGLAFATAVRASL